MFIVDYLHSIGIRLSTMQEQKALTLQWGTMEPHFGRWFRLCGKNFSQEMQPIVRLWMNVVAQPHHFPRCKAKNHWHSIEAEWSDRVFMLCEAVSRRKAANWSIMDEFSRTVHWFSMMQGLKWLTLHWCSCLGHSDDVVESIFAFKGGR